MRLYSKKRFLLKIKAWVGKPLSERRILQIQKYSLNTFFFLNDVQFTFILNKQLCLLKVCFNIVLLKKFSILYISYKTTEAH